MVPALLIVRLLEQAGGTEALAWLLSPLMSPLGLPNEFGLVWAAAILTNVYTAMIVFYELSSGHELSVMQVSTVGVMILISHALPIEGAVAKVLGVPWRLTIVLRIAGSYLLGFFCALGFTAFNLGEGAASSLWQPDVRATDWGGWLLGQAQMLLSIFVILAALIAFLRMLRQVGLERLMSVLLQPLMRIMTVSRDSANVTIVGLMLGLSFGAGLLIDEGRSGRISKRDMQVVACFLGLCHSVIEDTLLILLLGADIVPILFGRFVFSCLIIALIARYVYPKGAAPIES
jgi:hypothetical protein